MFSLTLRHRVLPSLLLLMLVFSALSATAFAYSDTDDSLRFQELLARFETRRASRNAEAAKHGVILPSQKSIAVAADEIAPPSGVAVDIPDDPLLKHLIPMTEAEADFPVEAKRDISLNSTKPAPLDPVITAPADDAEMKLVLATPSDKNAKQIPLPRSTETTAKSSSGLASAKEIPLSAPTCSELPVFHSHDSACAQPTELPTVRTVVPPPVSVEPALDSSNQGFKKVLAKMESRREKRNAEAAKLNIQLPSAGGSFPTSSPALERLNSALRTIIHQSTAAPIG